MPAGKQDILIEQGAGFFLELDYEDAAGKPIDLTGYTAKAEARRHYPDASPFLTFSVALGGKTGVITLTATAAQTSSLEKPGRWDLKLTPSGGEPFRLLEGKVDVSLQVTK